jgi:hypothetical protein
MYPYTNDIPENHIVSRIIRVDSKTHYIDIKYVDESVSRIHKTIVLILDYSKSMKGSPFRCCRDAICAVLRPLVEKFDDIILLMFNHYITEFVVTKANVDDVIHRISLWNECGDTNFPRVLARVCQILAIRTIEYNYKIDFRVSFFTDGYHYSEYYNNREHTHHAEHKYSSLKDIYNTINANYRNRHRLYKVLRIMTRSMRSSNISIAGGNTKIVCRAYDGYNDVNTMMDIAYSGITPGDYKYSSTSDGIKNIIINDYLLTDDSISASVITNSGNGDIHTDMNIYANNSSGDEKTDMSYSYEGGVFINSDILVNAVITVDINGSKFPINTTETKVTDHEMIIISMKYNNEILSVVENPVSTLVSGSNIKTSNIKTSNIKTSNIKTSNNIINTPKYIKKIQFKIKKVIVRMKRSGLAVQFKAIKYKMRGNPIK